jgi:transcriptional regulator with XRE-family HTH domain
LGHSEHGLGDNGDMPKVDIKEIFVRNVKVLKLKTGRNQKEIAKAGGVSEAHLSEILNGLSVPTITTVQGIASAFGVPAWMLLADSEETRQWALMQLAWGPSVPDKEVAKHLPLPPGTKEVRASPKKIATKRKRKS